ncbi:MAG: ATP-binding protein [Bacteroidota bacterium]|nr:ATP-binding protein [Bacteroidota bacterium]
MLFKVKDYFLLISFLCLILPAVYSQDQRVADSLKIIYNEGTLNDADRLELLKQLSFNEVMDLNLSLKYAEELINLAISTGNNKLLHSGYFLKGNKKRLFGDLEEALDAYIKSAETARLENNTRGEGNAYGAIADIYSISNNHSNARLYYNKAIAILRESNDSVPLASVILNAGDFFMNNQIYDTAYVYFKESEIIFEKLNYLIGKAYSIGNIGMVYANTGESNLAEKNIREAIEILEELGDFYPICVYLVSMADIYIEKGDDRAALNYALKSLTLARQYGLKEQIRDANLKLSELYERAGNMEESYKYYKDYITFRDSINNIITVQSLANLRTDFEVSRKQAEVDLLNHQKQNQRWWLITIAGILFSTFAVLFMFYRNNKNKQKANALLQEQKEKVENTLINLKATQSQLIQSEKMASLGELTAGIAHEIQNPLNFVNNFSELSNELIDEMKDELAAGNWQLATEIADDVKQNLEKINHHGKRADAIVKGMLQHSRSSNGHKEPTDINKLADEYLRLAFHGLKAKDKSFNAEFIPIAIGTDFDPTLPKINVIPQDIGRVLLNLINNAFYAVTAPLPPEGGFKDPNYVHKPVVIVKTSYLPPSGGMRGACLISVKDNGPGISPEIVDKIFQPFFTTKPTGQGTGLGLSLAYDIVKAHGGELKVETKEGEGSEFIIHLPYL